MTQLLILGSETGHNMLNRGDKVRLAVKKRTFEQNVCMHALNICSLLLYTAGSAVTSSNVVEGEAHPALVLREPVLASLQWPDLQAIARQV